MYWLLLYCDWLWWRCINGDVVATQHQLCTLSRRWFRPRFDHPAQRVDADSRNDVLMYISEPEISMSVGSEMPQVCHRCVSGSCVFRRFEGPVLASLIAQGHFRGFWDFLNRRPSILVSRDRPSDPWKVTRIVAQYVNIPSSSAKAVIMCNSLVRSSAFLLILLLSVATADTTCKLTH